MSFYKGLDTVLQGQIDRIKVKQPAKFWMRLDNSFFSLNRGNVLLFKLGEQLKEINANLPNASTTKQLESALDKGADLTACIEDFYSNYHAQMQASVKLIKRYRLDNWWFASAKKESDYYCGTFVNQAYAASLHGIFQTIEQRLANPSLTSEQLHEYAAGLALITSKINTLIINHHYSPTEKQRFFDLTHTADGLQKSISKKIGIIEAFSAANNELTNQFNGLMARIEPSLKNQQERIANLQPKLQLLQAKFGKQEQYKAALDNATNKKKVIEDSVKKKVIEDAIQYALGALTKVVEENVLAKETKQDFEKNSAEYQAYLDFIDALSQQQNRPGGEKIRQLMVENHLKIDDVKITARKYFDKYIDIVSKKLALIKKDEENLRANKQYEPKQYEPKLVCELAKLTFILTGIVRMYGMKDYKDLFNTPCEKHGCEFLKQVRSEQKDVLAKACQTVYTYFTRWVENTWAKKQPQVKNINHNTKVTDKKPPQSTQTGSQAALFKSNSSDKIDRAALEAIVAQQAQQQVKQQPGIKTR